MNLVYPNIDISKIQDSKRPSRNIVIYCILCCVLLGTYIDKYVIFAIGNQGTLGMLALSLLPLICAPIIVAVVFEVAALVYALFKKNYLPAISFIPLFLLIIWLPLPPLPPSDTEKQFYNQQTEYQAVVDLARKGQFPQNPPFNAHIEKQNPLVILFNPYDDFYTYIAYAQKREDLDNTDVCFYDGGIHSQIGDTWWLCFREWN